MSEKKHIAPTEKNDFHNAVQSSSACDYPKTLIVGGLPSKHYGTGIYLARIFTSWPIEQLACAARIGSPPDFSRCDRFFRLGTREFVPPPLISTLLPKISSGPVHESADASPSNNEANSGDRPNSRLIKLRAFVRRLLMGGDLLYRPRISRQFLDWMEDFGPEILYGQCSTLATARFLRRLQTKTGLPLVLHCMDDFAEGHYRAGWGKALDGHLFRSEFRRLIASSAAVIAICKEMAVEYQQRYQRPVTWIDMPANLAPYEALKRTTWQQGKEFRIRYGGRVGWGIQDSLADVAAAVHELREEGYPISFDIVKTNAGDAPKACLNASGVRVLPPEPLDQVPLALTQADILLICYDFDEQSYRESRFSMPSKLPECMASGTPVLVYGPAGLPVVEYARNKNWGKVIDQQNKKHLKSALLALCSSEAERKRLGSSAASVAFHQHNAARVSEELHNIIKKAFQQSHNISATEPVD